MLIDRLLPARDASRLMNRRLVALIEPLHLLSIFSTTLIELLDGGFLIRRNVSLARAALDDRQGRLFGNLV